MQQYNNQVLTGERALFMTDGARIENCTFEDGESPLKESRNLDIESCNFRWKYPLWYCNHVDVKNSSFFEMGRAGIWYTNDIHMKNVMYEAPKGFRRCDGVDLEDVDFANAAETFWNCSHVVMKNVTARGEYFAMGSSDMELENFTLFGNYPFDGCKNITIRNSKLMSKDAFWNCENVTIYDSYISGQYFGWNSKNVTLINCTVESDQGMCYMDNIVMKNCKMPHTDLAFEYCTVDAEIVGSIDSIKNPYSGRIQTDSIGEIIFDDPKIVRAATEIDV